VPKVLDALAITTAVTGVTSAVVGSGSGTPGGLLVQIDFVYGSGGTSGKVWLQTSLDGSSWIDVANMTFTTASKSRIMNLSADTVIATPYTVTDGTLADDTVKDGIIGGVYRTKLTTIGTYAGGTTLSVTILPGS
jgi:hypothetical protein